MKRDTVRVAVFVILRQWSLNAGADIYLMRRAGTSHEEGQLGLPSGHWEAGETPKEAAVRELLEETGLELDDDDFELVYTQFNQTAGEGGEDYLNLFFEAFLSHQEPRIAEPDKCSEALWLTPREVFARSDIVPYIRTVIEQLVEFNDTYGETTYAARA